MSQERRKHSPAFEAKVALEVVKGVETPSQVSPGSVKSVYWKCRRGHEWKASVRAVVMNRGYCAKCNSLEVRYRDIARQWDYKRNPDTPMDVAGASPKLRF